MCFEKTIVLKRLRESYHLSDVPKSEIFVHFTKNIAATWSIIKIIAVSIALDTPCLSEAFGGDIMF